jgi:hypothetical protein
VAKNLHVDEFVYVPRSRVGLDANSQSAFYNGRVVEVKERSVKISLPTGVISEDIPTSAVHRNIKVLIIKIGDFDTEDTLLDPLQKSVSFYFKLLLSDEELVFRSVRTTEELSIIWAKEHSVISYVIIIGHGKESAIKFGDKWVESNDVGKILNIGGVSPKQFISLCCKTGYADFGKEFSKFPVCESLISPFQSVHGSIASQFCQTYFAYHLLLGETTGVAFKHARNVIPGAVSFRLWKNEKLIAGQKTY